MKTPEITAQETFGQRAATYSTSSCHTDPQILGRVVELSGILPSWRVLDLGTGTGHTAFALAPHAACVIGADLTPEMLAEARKLGATNGRKNTTFHLADAHHLPYDDGSFDLVTCRRAAHHFSDIAHALGEVRRVLPAGGRLVIDDRSVPEDDFVDRCMNELDRLHDASHVRQYRPGEWVDMLVAAGFELITVEPYQMHRPLAALTAQVAADDVLRIRDLLDGLDEKERVSLRLEEKEGQLFLNHWYVMLAAKKA